MSTSGRALLRFLTLVCVTTVGASLLGAAPAVASEIGCTRNPDWAEMDRGWANDVIELTNAHRAVLGLPELLVSESLTGAAEWKAAHMANYGYMSHDDPAPPIDRSWDQRIEECGYTHGMGENIAFGYRTPLAVVQGWIGSDGHRRNIEDPDFRVIGVGAALDERGTPYWAQIFGTAVDGEVRSDLVDDESDQSVERQDDEIPGPVDEPHADDEIEEGSDSGDGHASDASGEPEADVWDAFHRASGQANPWRWRFGIRGGLR